MSLALKFKDTANVNDETAHTAFIFLDAVTQYSRDFRGQVTSHPIESGGNISDHFIRNNPTYNISGVITAADISLGLLGIQDDLGNRPLNVPTTQVQAVTIKGGNNELLSKLPESVAQYFVNADASVVVSPNNSRRNLLASIRVQLENLFTKDKLSLVTLYEYKNNRLTNVIIDNLVMTSLNFKEDPDSGIALYVDITLEKVEFVSFKTAKVPKTELSGLTAEKKKVGDKKPDTPTPLSEDEKRKSLAAQVSAFLSKLLQGSN